MRLNQTWLEYLRTWAVRSTASPQDREQEAKRRALRAIRMTRVRAASENRAVLPVTDPEGP